MNDDLPIRDGVVVPAAGLSWRTSRASGPGGQHVNTSDTKVQLRVDLAAVAAVVPAGVLARLRQAEAGRITATDELVVDCGASRSRQRNIDEARERVAAMINAVWTPPKRRRKTRPTKASQERRLKAKAKRGAVKSKRGRVDPE